MPRSKTNKLSCSISKPARGSLPPRRSNPPRAEREKFSLWHYPFAVPLSLRALLRLATAVILLLLPSFLLHAEMGSVWKTDSSRSMFADKRARTVGDIVTILVQENTSASKDNSTK